MFQCALADILYLVFKPPFLTLAGACAITLPGQVRTILGSDGETREQAKLRAGSILAALIVGFWLALAVASTLGRPGFAKTDQAGFVATAKAPCVLRLIGEARG